MDNTTINILVVTDSINPEDSSGSKANVAFIKSLVASGYMVFVIHYTHIEIQIKGAKCTLAKERRTNLLYVLGGIQRIAQRNLGVNWSVFLENCFGFSFTFYNDIKSIVNKIKSLNVHDFDLVITLSKGESFRPHYGVLQVPEWHQKWLAYVHDPYPFQHYPKPYTFMPKGAKQKDAFFMRVAESCRFGGFPSLYLLLHMSQFYPEFAHKSILIPHQYDPNVLGVSLPSFFNTAGFNLVHTGNLIDGRSPEGLLEGFNLFLERIEEAKADSFLYLVGPSSNYKKLIGSFAHIPQLITHTSVSYAESLALQQAASVNLIIEASDTDFSPFLPAKMAHCVMVDKPILALSPKKSEVRRLLGESYPWQCEADESEQIAGILSELYLNWKNTKAESWQLNRPDLQNYFSSEYLNKQIQNILNASA
ncbi:UDP-glycosyltransferase [Leeuwenhoekiella marinoflava]|uniref:UDP-glycosyltransferase n=1 Tax=Leeuwenhoekiella marinoflava TaxID=988 RepID=UPI00300388F3